MGKMASPNTRITWVPANGFASAATGVFTAAELNAGTNISDAVESGYTLAFTDSDTNDSKSITDEGNVVNRGFANYEANITLFRSDLTAVTAAYNTANAIFEGGSVTGYLVSRHGRKASVAFATGDVISVFKVTSDHRRILEEDAGGPIKTQIPFFPQGEGWANVTV